MTNDYEASVKRLEEITALLEKGNLPLEETLKLFSEGTALLSSCSEYLDSAEKKITELLKNEEPKA